MLGLFYQDLLRMSVIALLHRIFQFSTARRIKLQLGHVPRRPLRRTVILPNGRRLRKQRRCQAGAEERDGRDVGSFHVSF